MSRRVNRKRARKKAQAIEFREQLKKTEERNSHRDTVSRDQELYLDPTSWQFYSPSRQTMR